MPTIQSASERERAACSSGASSAAGRSVAKASFIAVLVIEFSHSRRTGLLGLGLLVEVGEDQLALATGVAGVDDLVDVLAAELAVTTDICLRERSSRTTSLKCSGTIGRSAIRQRLNFGSYSSGSASCTRWPTAQVIDVLGGLEVALLLLEGPGARAPDPARRRASRRSRASLTSRLRVAGGCPPVSRSRQSTHANRTGSALRARGDRATRTTLPSPAHTLPCSPHRRRSQLSDRRRGPRRRSRSRPRSRRGARRRPVPANTVVRTALAARPSARRSCRAAPARAAASAAARPDRGRRRPGSGPPGFARCVPAGRRTARSRDSRGSPRRCRRPDLARGSAPAT